MKYCLLAFYGGLALAQSSSTLYTTDINGHVVPEAQYTARDGESVVLNQSINGRQVPMQRTETRVLSEEPNHRVTETIVRKYDPTGQLTSTERTVADEQKTASGSTVHAAVFRSDLNGRLQETEHRVVESQVRGATTTAEVSVSRVGLNGSFETVEKRRVETTTSFREWRVHRGRAASTGRDQSGGQNDCLDRPL
jgi:hypothetical protein